MDKGSWFENEQAYLEEKLGFHTSMGDQLDQRIPYSGEGNSVQFVEATYTTGVSGKATRMVNY